MGLGVRGRYDKVIEGPVKLDVEPTFGVLFQLELTVFSVSIQ